MRPAVLLLAALPVLSAGPGAAQFTIESLAGPTNLAAMDAAAACNTDEALRLSAGEMSARNASRRLMAHYVQAAVLTDIGRTAEANRLMQEAAADPKLNPGRQDLAAFARPAGATLTAIRDRRRERTGRSGC